MDIAPSMISLAQENNTHSEKVKYILNESDRLSIIESNSVDFIYTRLTLQHMEPKYALSYLKEFARVLKSDGVLLFHLPSHRSTFGQKQFQSFQTGIRGLLKRLLPTFLLNQFRHIRSLATKQPIMELYGVQKDEVLQAMAKTGLVLVSLDEFGDCGPEWVSNRYVYKK